MGRSERDKGARGELELAHILRDQYGYPVGRGSVFNRTSDLVGLSGIHPEVKRVERLNVQAAMNQAVQEAGKRRDGVPTVFHRRNRTEWLVTMRLDDWIDLYGAWTGSPEEARKKHELRTNSEKSGEEAGRKPWESGRKAVEAGKKGGRVAAELRKTRNARK